jgi:hypothetical protein
MFLDNSILSERLTCIRYNNKKKYTIGYGNSLYFQSNLSILNLTAKQEKIKVLNLILNMKTFL